MALLNLMPYCAQEDSPTGGLRNGLATQHSQLGTETVVAFCAPGEIDVDYSTFPVQGLEKVYPYDRAAEDASGNPPFFFAPLSDDLLQDMFMFRMKGRDIDLNRVKIYEFIHATSDEDTEMNLSMVDVRLTGARCPGSSPFRRTKHGPEQRVRQEVYREYTKPTVSIDAIVVHMEHGSPYMIIHNEKIVPGSCAYSWFVNFNAYFGTNIFY